MFVNAPRMQPTETYQTAGELIHAIIHGNLTRGFPEPPSRVVKIFLSSTKSDFECERQHLHEIVLPKLEQFCSALAVDLLVIDPHWQMQPINTPTSDPNTTTTPPKELICNGKPAISVNDAPGQPAQAQRRAPIIYDPNINCINPHEFELQKHEIAECSIESATTFFMCLIGHKYRPLALPTVIPSEDFQQIFSAASESGMGDANVLRTCYKENKNLQPSPQYVLLEPRRASRQYDEELEHIAKLVEYGSKVAAREGLLSDQFGSVMSAVHQQTLYALHCARLAATGCPYSPTSFPTNVSGTAITHMLPQTTVPPPPTMSTKSLSKPLSSLPTINSAKSSPNHVGTKLKTSNFQNTKPIILNDGSKSPLTPTRRLKNQRLIHQQSLQQGPTQKKIVMPQRQASVTQNYALFHQPIDRMLCFVRQFEGVNFNNSQVSRFFDVTPTITASSEDGQTLAIAQPPATPKQLFAPAAQNDIQQLIEDVILGLKKGNVHYFNISWSPPEGSKFQSRTYTLPEHYIERFGETVYRTLCSAISTHLDNSSPSVNNNLMNSGIQKNNNAIQSSMVPLNFQYPSEVVREAHSHMTNFRRILSALGMAQAIDSDFAYIINIRELILNYKQEHEQAVRLNRPSVKHQPIILTGPEGSGKSTLLTQVFTYAPEWLSSDSDRDFVVRIVRQCGTSPSSNFASELLRSLCMQIAIAYRFESQMSRCSEAHELSELAICLQELLKMVETAPGGNGSDLLIVLDDLHHLQSSVQSSAILGWLPWNLPFNVHLICSVTLEESRIVELMRSRLSPDHIISLGEPLKEDEECKKKPVIQYKPHSIFSTIQCKLRDEKRTLSAVQWDYVKETLKAKQEIDFMKRPELKPKHEKDDDVYVSEFMTPLYANMLATSVLCQWESFHVPDYLPTTVEEVVCTILDDIEECLPYALVRRICSYITCTKYGLRESELFNLVQETLVNQVWPTIVNVPGNSGNITGNGTSVGSSGSSTPQEAYEYPKSTSNTWLLLKRKLRPLTKEYYVQGRLYFHWRAPKVARAVRDRYLIDIRQIRATHQELSSAFYSTFTELISSTNECPNRMETENVREADELWHHLFHSGNKELLKNYALLNVRFLKTILEGVSVCYLKCILDSIRVQILDWDIELVYAMLKQSIHVISQEPSQLPVEALLWLVPFLGTSGPFSLNPLLGGGHSNSHGHSHASSTNKSPATILTCNGLSPSPFLEEFIKQCYRLCCDHRKPLLYPQNVWLNLPFPPQVAMISSPWSSITRAVTTPDSQHLIVAVGNMLHFFHLQTKSIAKSIEGHKDTITCLSLAPSGRWLATGSSDSTVHLWQVDVSLMEVNECRLRYRLNYHSAAVLCVTINHSESVVLSGSEYGTICAVSIRNGTIISRLEHHRGMVTCLAINTGDDVLVSGSTDRTVVVWSLDTFCILNEILLMKPVLHMHISLDSTFLLLALDDNSLQVRALTTGTGVHNLQTSVNPGQSSVVTFLRFAEDNARIVVGYADGRLVLFDIHSGRQLQTLNGHTDMITSILPQKNDHFMITCGGNKIIIWNFYPVKRLDQPSNAIEQFNEKLNVHMDNHPLDSIVGSQGSSLLTQQLTELGVLDQTKCDISGSGSHGSGSGCGSGTGSATGAGGSISGEKSGKNSRSSSDRRKQRPSGSFRKKFSITSHFAHHREPITCMTVSRDGQYIVTGSRDTTVKIWWTITGETHTTIEEHSSTVTSVDMAANSQAIASGSDDGTIFSYSLTLSMIQCKFVEHVPYTVSKIRIMSDMKRVVSVDCVGTYRLWSLDTGVQYKVIPNRTNNCFTLHGNIAFAIGGKMDNCLKYWSCYEPETTEKSVSHSDTITCFTCTHSGKTIITGSQDMSLKVWEAATAKLTQVLVGHEGGISCVANAALNEILAVSGSQDCNLIVWDMATGSDLFTLTGHNANVMGVILTPDASRAISYSEDNTIQLWDITQYGQRLSILDVHHNFVDVCSSMNASYLAVFLGGSSHMIPVIKHHNNPAANIVVELPSVGTPVTPGIDEKSPNWLKSIKSRQAMAKSLKREQSFDSFYFEHMLQRGQSCDDFRKIGALSTLTQGQALATPSIAGTGISPFGSREKLQSLGHGAIDPCPSVGTNILGTTTPVPSNSSRSRMISKLMNIGPKQKMLKKQQSMFACFPEHSPKISSTSVINASTTDSFTIKGNGTIGDSFNKIHPTTPQKSIHIQNTKDPECDKIKLPNDKNTNSKIAVTDSAVCSIQ